MSSTWVGLNSGEIAQVYFGMDLGYHEVAYSPSHSVCAVIYWHYIDIIGKSTSAYKHYNYLHSHLLPVPTPSHTKKTCAGGKSYNTHRVLLLRMHLYV